MKVTCAGLCLVFCAGVVAEESTAAIARRILDHPFSVKSIAECGELSRRGSSGWSALARIARESARRGNTPLANAAVDALGSGPDGRRHRLLRGLYHSADKDRGRVLIALMRWYPKDARLVDKYLEGTAKDRVRVLEAAARYGMPAEKIRSYLKNSELKGAAQKALTVRRWGFKNPELIDSLRGTALDGLDPRRCLETAGHLAARRDPNTFLALALLLLDSDKRVRDGSHLVLLTVSGKDLAPDADIWRSWISARGGEPGPVDLSSPGVVAAAIIRGVRYLRRELFDGHCTWAGSPNNGHEVGATALAVLALRAAKVPSDDLAIQRALKRTLLVFDKTGAALRSLGGYTYGISLLAMALAAVDAKRYREQIQTIALQLSRGQLANGAWTYRCRATEARAHRGDNSNAQYAILGLRAAMRAGVPVTAETWKRAETYWRETRNASRGWGYTARSRTSRELSMTAAGLGSLAICLEGLHGREAAKVIDQDPVIEGGLVRLGALLLRAGYEKSELYALYGVERAGILTGTRAFEEFDWYRKGAYKLVISQDRLGAWGISSPRSIARGEGYGHAIDTAYALLFLKRATTRIGDSQDRVVRVPDAVRKKKAPWER
jgi:hypothetical protein